MVDSGFTIFNKNILFFFLFLLNRNFLYFIVFKKWHFYCLPFFKNPYFIGFFIIFGNFWLSTFTPFTVYLYPIYCLPLPHLLSTFWLFFLIYCLPFISEDTVQNCHTRRRIKHGKLVIWKYMVVKNIKKMSKTKIKNCLALYVFSYYSVCSDC